MRSEESKDKMIGGKLSGGPALKRSAPLVDVERIQQQSE